MGNPFRLILDEAEKALTPSALQNRVKIVKAVIDTMRKAKEISHITLVSLKSCCVHQARRGCPVPA